LLENQSTYRFTMQGAEPSAVKYSKYGRLKSTHWQIHEWVN